MSDYDKSSLLTFISGVSITALILLFLVGAIAIVICLHENNEHRIRMIEYENCIQNEKCEGFRVGLPAIHIYDATE